MTEAEKKSLPQIDVPPAYTSILKLNANDSAVETWKQKQRNFDLFNDSVNTFMVTKDLHAKKNALIHIINTKDSLNDYHNLLATDGFFKALYNTTFYDLGNDDLTKNCFKLLQKLIQNYKWSIDFILKAKFDEKAYKMLFEENDTSIHPSYLFKFLVNIMSIDIEKLHNIFNPNTFFMVLYEPLTKKIRMDDANWIIEVFYEIFSIDFFDVSECVESIVEAFKNISKSPDCPRSLHYLIFETYSNLFITKIADEQKLLLIDQEISDFAMCLYDYEKSENSISIIRYLNNAVCFSNEFCYALINNEEFFRIIFSIQDSTSPELVTDILQLINNMIACGGPVIETIWNSEIHKLAAIFRNYPVYKPRKFATLIIYKLMMISEYDNIIMLLQHVPIASVCDDLIIDDEAILSHVVAGLINLLGKIQPSKPEYEEINNELGDPSIADRLNEIISEYEPPLTLAADFLYSKLPKE